MQRAWFVKAKNNCPHFDVEISVTLLHIEDDASLPFASEKDPCVVKDMMEATRQQIINQLIDQGENAIRVWDLFKPEHVHLVGMNKVEG